MNINLSDRLQMVATLVDVGAKVIDVGCDHAYLSIYLTLNNNNNCIATDINKNALESAKKNIKKYKLDKKIEVLLNDGLKDMDINSSDNIVICGMGYHTIMDILSSNNLSDTLIISSNNNVDELRRSVINKGYYIDSEIFVIDNKIGYVIIKFRRGIKKYSDNQYLFGPILKTNMNYKKYLINKYKNIRKNISNKKVLIKLKYSLMILKIKLYFKKSKKIKY